MDVTKEVTATLRAGMGSHKSLVSQTGTQAAVNLVRSFHVNQRDEVIDLDGLSGALMATRNMQMQTFVAQTPDYGVVSKGDGDCYLTLESHTSLTGGGGQAGQGYPCVLCLNDQGDSQMHLTEDKTGTLRVQEHGHQPLVLASQQGGAEIGEGVCPTITGAAGTSGNNQPVLFENRAIHASHAEACREDKPAPAVFSLDSKEVGGMKSADPYSGCRETDVARTIDTTNPDPSKNQGGIAILQETFCISGNIIDRQPQNGGNGFGCQPDLSYTLTAMDNHAVFSPQGDSGPSGTEERASSETVTEETDTPGTYQETVGSLCGDDKKGIGNQYVSQDKCIVEKRNLIRRLTPLECERLQGFPDGWTDIPGASDSARYKALGNSVAIPCVDFILKGIAYFLRKCGRERQEKDTT